MDDKGGSFLITRQPLRLFRRSIFESKLYDTLQKEIGDSPGVSSSGNRRFAQTD